MLLGNKAIREAIRAGEIVCDPMPDTIEGTHIDVTIGSNYFLARPNIGVLDLSSADRIEEYSHYFAHGDDPIFLPPQALVLAHTVEFIGTTVPHIQPVMFGRSTLARWGVQIHLSAGWGDPGYCSRWVMEIVNHRQQPVTIPVGARVGCIAFLRVEGNDSLYTRPYNTAQEDWQAYKMLPKSVTRG